MSKKCDLKMKKTLLTLAVCSIVLSACSKGEIENVNKKNENAVVLDNENIGNSASETVVDDKSTTNTDKVESDVVVEPTLDKSTITIPTSVKYPVSGQSIALLHSKWNLQAVKPNLQSNSNICNDASITPLILMEMAQAKGFVAKSFPNEHKKNKVDVPRWSDLDVKVDKLSPEKPLTYTIGIEAELDRPTSISVMKNDVSTLWENYGNGQKIADSTDSYLYVEIKDAQTISASEKGGNLTAKCKVEMLVAEGYRTWHGLLFADMVDLPVTSFLPLNKTPINGNREQNTVTKVITIKESKGAFKVLGL